ncbi:MAG: hypothetical protein R3F55_15010 [Alphaproteobacteria bacterium]
MFDTSTHVPPAIAELFEIDSEIIGSDTSKRRRDTDKVPFRYICQVVTTAQVTTPAGTFNITSRGTGTLIAPRTVLTAAHNLVLTKQDLVDAGVLSPTASFNPRLAKAREVTVNPGRDGGSKPFPSANGAARFFFPGYLVRNAAGTVTDVRSATDKDIAILRIDRDLSASVGFWGEPRRAGDSTGTSVTRTGALPQATGTLQVNLSGYPVDDRSVSSPKPEGTQWSSFNLTVRKGSVNGAGGLLLYFNDTLGGHSGSPVWVTRHSSMGGRVLVGVHVRRFRRSNRPFANAAVQLTGSHIAFIDRHKR